MKRASSSQVLASSEFSENLQNEIFLKAFKDYCQREYNVENLLFWLDVEAFRGSDDSQRVISGQKIYNTYIAAEAPLQINISQALRTSLPQPLPSPVPTDIFNEMQHHVFDMMKIDSLPRFSKTDAFLQIQHLKETGNEDSFSDSHFFHIFSFFSN